MTFSWSAVGIGVFLNFSWWNIENSFSIGSVKLVKLYAQFFSCFSNFSLQLSQYFPLSLGVLL